MHQSHTNTMSARSPAVAFRPELIALVACSTDSSSSRPTCSLSSLLLGRLIWTNLTLSVVVAVRVMVITNVAIRGLVIARLVQLLQRVLRALSQSI